MAAQYIVFGGILAVALGSYEFPDEHKHDIDSFYSIIDVRKANMNSHKIDCERRTCLPIQQ